MQRRIQTSSGGKEGRAWWERRRRTKKKAKNCKITKWGAHWSSGSFYNPLDLGLEAVATTKTQFVFFFLLKLKP
jgi:hypothetical protein